MVRRFTLIGILTFLNVLLSVFVNGGFANGLPLIEIPVKPQAPAMQLQTYEGKPFDLADHRGRVVVVNFWATWCAPCVREMPGIDKLQAKLGGKDFTVVAVNEDRGGVASAKQFLEKLGTTNLALYVDSKMAMMRAFKVRGLPTSFLLDREGRIVGKLEGIAEWDTPEAEDLIRYYTKQTTSAQTLPKTAISG